MTKNDSILNLIEGYKQRIKQKRLKDEVYKWEFIQKNNGKPNVNAQDFSKEIQSIKLGNLVYRLTGSVLNILAKEKEEELREVFESLFDESSSLEQRIINWDKNIKIIYQDIQGKHSSHQDERAISVYLTLHNSLKYTFYKSSYYLKFCELLNTKPKKKGLKFVHYMELINMLVNDYISKDSELINIVKSLIPEHYNGTNHLLLAQDILFQMLDQKKDINYWVFQGNPKIFDFETALKEEVLKDWKVSAHKDKIKIGDKVILWITGNESGCYALAEVTSKPKDKDISEDDHLWKDGNNTHTLKASIKITHNFVDKPILWDEIKDLEEFREFKGGNQGTNFSSKKEEYKAFLGFTTSISKLDYNKIKKKLDPIKFKEYLNVLRNFIDKTGLTPNDDRISFNIRGNNLAFLIGNRYTLNIYRKKGETLFSFLSKDRLVEDSGTFSHRNGNIEAYWNGSVDELKDYEENIYESLQIELNRNHKSPYRRYSNKDFINDVFQTKTNMETKNKKEIGVLNTIFYGPPGTGKTYELQKTYFDKFTIKESSLTKEQYLEKIISELTWWQVLSIVVLDLGNTKVSDIFNHEFIQIKAKLSNSKSIRPTLWGQLQSHTVMNCPNVNISQRSEPLLFYKDKNSRWSINNELLEENYPEALDLLKNSKNFVPSHDNKIKNYEFVTFHQSFGYEDFVEGIKPKMEDGQDDLSYEIKDGVFKKLCLKATADSNNNYAIFIDEINRGNVSAIFGELITLIENDKRLGEENELTVTLPYSKEEFGVPNNLYVFGTMNTADRSVEALDTALRRRFIFKEIMPKPNKLKDITFRGFDLKEVLKVINRRIEVLLDRDHTIGHSYFIKLKPNDINGLKSVFSNNIIPLLQEYFYHDYEKIALILGEGFVEEKKNNIDFASFKDIEGPDVEKRYKLISEIEDIEKAIIQLLNKNAEK